MIELSLTANKAPRSKLSVTLVIPAILIVAWVHWGVVQSAQLAYWLIGMGLVQILRLVLANGYLRADEGPL